MQRRPRRWNLKLAAAFLLAVTALVAQDPTSFLNSDVLRVGSKLACRCGGCRNTVANCPMLHCSSADPMRRRIYQMKMRAMTDDAVLSTIVREEGVVALASPPAEGFGLVTWIMPPIVLLVGFIVYSSYVQRNRKEPEPLSATDQAIIDRFRLQIERELDEPPSPHELKPGTDVPK